MGKVLKDINEQVVTDALQILSNFCKQNAKQDRCDDCILRMNDTTCLFYAELPGRFQQWKEEHR